MCRRGFGSYFCRISCRRSFAATCRWRCVKCCGQPKYWLSLAKVLECESRRCLELRFAAGFTAYAFMSSHLGGFVGLALRPVIPLSLAGPKSPPCCLPVSTTFSTRLRLLRPHLSVLLIQTIISDKQWNYSACEKSRVSIWPRSYTGFYYVTFTAAFCAAIFTVILLRLTRNPW